MGKNIKTNVPDLDSIKEQSNGDYQVHDMDSREKSKQKLYADKQHRATEKQIKVGDLILVNQEKSTLRPPWDTEPYLVAEVHDTKLYLTRDRNQRSVARINVSWLSL